MLGFFLKILLLVIIIILIRGTLPRYRIDQLTTTAWKSLIFLYLSYFFMFLVILMYVHFYDPAFFLDIGIKYWND